MPIRRRSKAISPLARSRRSRRISSTTRSSTNWNAKGSSRRPTRNPEYAERSIMNQQEKNFKVVGTSVPRADGAEKVSGRTRYAADIDCPGALWAKILRSPYPHAKLLRVDVSKARHVPGVKAIVTGEEAKNCYIGKQIRDMPVLCWDVVRFIGDRVAAVAAETCD